MTISKSLPSLDPQRTRALELLLVLLLISPERHA